MADCAVPLQIELEKRGTVLPKSLMVVVSNKAMCSVCGFGTYTFCASQPLDNEEHTMFRFLKARKMNVEAAADMLQSKALQATVCE